MSNVSQIPTLRFPEFNNEWKNKKFKDVVKVNQGLAILKSNRFSNKSDNRLNYITIPYLDGKVNEYIENPNESVICYEDDVIVTRTGSGLGKIWTGNYGVFHNNFFKVLPKDENISKKFIYHYLKSQNIQNKMRQYAGVGAIPDLNHGDFYLLPFYLTSLKEQQKIASFLSSVDKKIKLLQEKKDLLEEYKKGVMQQIFNQQLRFKDDDGNDYPDWVDMRLANVCDINKGKQLNAEFLTEDAKYPCINGGINASGNTDNYNREKNTITISEGGNSCGYVNFLETKFWCGGHCYSLDKVVNQVNNKYLYQALKFAQIKIMRLRVGSGLPNIQKKDISKFKVSIPTINEQNKIAQFLNTIDSKIELVNNQIDNTQNFKKGLLQKMFV